MRKQIFAAAALAAAAAAAAPGPATAEDNVELGMLDCYIEGGVGLVLGSSRDLSCTFTPANKAQPPETYVGVVNKFGLDIGVTGDTIMRWLVVAPTDHVYSPGTLAGSYVGASAEASVGIGGGANVLVGGSSQTIALQPVSVQAQTGLNLAVGVSGFELRSAAAG